MTIHIGEDTFRMVRTEECSTMCTPVTPFVDFVGLVNDVGWIEASLRSVVAKMRGLLISRNTMS